MARKPPSIRRLIKLTKDHVRKEEQRIIELNKLEDEKTRGARASKECKAAKKLLEKDKDTLKRLTELE